MKAVIDPLAGFCRGVNRAISLVEKTLGEGTPLTVKGELIHNRLEVERLYRLGLVPIDHIGDADGRAVLVRTHGEEAGFFALAKENDVEYLDATCPKVMRSQKVIRKAHDEGRQIVITGHLNHPEVIALQGHCENTAIIVNQEDSNPAIDPEKPTLLIAQTTVKHEIFLWWQNKLKGEIKDLEIFDSRCTFVTRRREQLTEFAKNHPALIFVGGKHSSNSNMLYGVCQNVNPNTLFIEDETELDPEWLKQFDHVGVSGSASTPMWLLKKVAEAIESFELERT